MGLPTLWEDSLAHLGFPLASGPTTAWASVPSSGYYWNCRPVPWWGPELNCRTLLSRALMVGFLASALLLWGLSTAVLRTSSSSSALTPTPRTKRQQLHCLALNPKLASSQLATCLTCFLTCKVGGDNCAYPTSQELMLRGLNMFICVDCLE